MQVGGWWPLTVEKKGLRVSGWLDEWTNDKWVGSTVSKGASSLVGGRCNKRAGAGKNVVQLSVTLPLPH